MFYLSSLTKEISVCPKDLKSDANIDIKTYLKNLISSKIRDLEGDVIGNHGYIISIIEFGQILKGKIDNETGKVNFKISYKAITFKPNVGEILNAFPIFINEYGFFCEVGHLRIFISKHNMEKDWAYNSEENTWVKKNSEKIVIGNMLRIKIIAFRINSNEITALAEIN